LLINRVSIIYTYRYYIEGVKMGTTTLEELYSIGLINQEELSALQEKMDYIPHKKAGSTPE